jgi:predicted NUDIX family phosphoesterase
MVEEVYVLPSNALPPTRQSVLPFERGLYDLLRTGGSFVPRPGAEGDQSIRQVIPYAILQHSGRTLLMRRTKAGGDARLHDRYSIGVGGHVNPPDAGDDPIEACLRREIAEEVEADLTSCRPVGFIHAAGDPVERVHTGVLYLAECAAPPTIRERDKLEGTMATLAEVEAVRDRLEGWSVIALDWLRSAGEGTI